MENILMNKKTDSMVKKLNRFKTLKLHYIWFLERFTRQDEDFIFNESNVFAEFIQNQFHKFLVEKNGVTGWYQMWRN